MDYNMHTNMDDKVHSNTELNDLGDEIKSSKVELYAKAKQLRGLFDSIFYRIRTSLSFIFDTLLFMNMFIKFSFHFS